MSEDVQFDTDIQNNALYARPRYSPGINIAQDASAIPGMAGWLIRHGWAKTIAAAQGIMIGLVVVNIIITFIVIKYFVL